MSIIGMPGLEPDDSMAQSEGWVSSGTEARSARVSWSEVAVAWVAVPVVLSAITAIIALLS
ncbi:hypothetical protein FFK22_014330 [Mycobacterium sp. KBS0706]|jgi:hypothetical protein|uniref:hypothetical protein n=1 Tax=Mycobacterium sp. KBS0706 TaxID=2578109 RepID=UPI00110FC62F|nr:hypothetical protein [Mycobacterium sp. KBS0706]TSD88012.1 hypothetical protein FFK22_014330 [Mycobacterium sp. KBS0706]